MKNNPVCWFEIYVQDLGRARTFYESLFQVQLETLTVADAPCEMLSFPAEIDRWGAGGALTKMDGVSSGSGGTLVYFSCEDCAVEEGRVEALGGQIHSKKTSIGEYGFISLVVDTEGNMIGLHSMQ
ncbi:VOC family protein [Tolumonas lignilytica]|jgi:Predicted enzyme related to lactoylglutathione lyase|uniref:VOC family protein n=1 Tax=Tolumonas lignilytica TaxID=1283284 RepID=UPI0004667496|nr:VOC family protein [Tolumonas lignilytica]